jgi:hypothetical protein
MVEMVMCSNAQPAPLVGDDTLARIARLDLLDVLVMTVTRKTRKAAGFQLSSTARASAGTQIVRQLCLSS